MFQNHKLSHKFDIYDREPNQQASFYSSFLAKLIILQCLFTSLHAPFVIDRPVTLASLPAVAAQW